MQDAFTPVRLLRYNSLRIPWEQQIRAHLGAAAYSRGYITIGSTSRLNFLALFLGVHSYSRANHGSFGLGSYEVGGQRVSSATDSAERFSWVFRPGDISARSGSDRFQPPLPEPC